MNNFYTTMSRTDKNNLDSKIIYGITAKERQNGKVVFADYRISCDFCFVERLATQFQQGQPTQDEFESIINKYKI